MALWLVRTGKFGEHEQKFLADGRLYLTWGGLNTDLSKVTSKADMLDLIRTTYPNFSPGKTRNHAGQIWTFAKRMKAGDWAVVPSKAKAAIHIAEITGGYEFDKTGDDYFYHSRRVKWVAKDIPRSVFPPDLLYSFGAIMTICGVKRNDAETRVHALVEGGLKSANTAATLTLADEEEEGDDIADLEEFARDQIAKQLIARFKGHGLERLVKAILEAQGFTVYHSPTGPDKGIDLLAAPGALGFGSPRICVQVKSSDTPVDSPTMNQLIGAMQNVHAEQGLLVSWGGFKSSVDKEVATQFFRVRLWNQHDLIAQLMANYEKLDEEIRAELPLKRIWALAATDEST